MKDIVNTDRVSQLRALLKILADAIDSRPGARDLASLSKQYRETLAEIEALEGNAPKNDQIEELLKNRKANGKSSAVRKNRAAVQRE
jgi:predicted nucleic acid-binding protein